MHPHPGQRATKSKSRVTDWMIMGQWERYNILLDAARDYANLSRSLSLIRNQFSNFVICLLLIRMLIALHACIALGTRPREAAVCQYHHWDDQL